MRDEFFLNCYNGSDGSVYRRLSLADFTLGDRLNAHTFYYYAPDAISWLQNGAPDGFALERMGAIIPGQFISYEGMFQATTLVVDDAG